MVIDIMAVVHGVGDFKTFPCAVCGKVLGRKFNLEEYMACVHAIGDRTGFACAICSRLLASFFFQSFLDQPAWLVFSHH